MNPDKLNFIELIIDRGFTVTGQVFDLDGKPVRGATVTEFHEELYRQVRTTTDRTGEFVMTGVTHPALVIDAPGLAMQFYPLTNVAETNRVRINMARGDTLRGHVVTETGEPVEDAHVFTSVGTRTRIPFPWEAVTDATGAFLWTSAPAGELPKFSVYAFGFKNTHSVTLRADGTDQTIVLHPLNN